MAMPVDADGTHAISVQKPVMDCKACGTTSMAVAPCNAMCAALPAIDPLAVNGPESGQRQSWALRPESGRSHFISPDTAPPRL